ncbi:methyltransferase [Ectothiorhodospira shaposhnikovii]|uniref:methyltransferase n=1 Tax=Ectothiorhodospira shaposhnikovii TaxID=1054 RepID=UPI00190637FB|nr:methyltransferase [Ectothiorhodospira shaposhnikovii]MBK1672992.1 methyltransferase [Ectothiorhodospira shaposhnikovii]
MSWRDLLPSGCGTHHVHITGGSAYDERFDGVLKFHAPGLAPVHRAGQAWHIREDGSPAYQRRFARTFGYYEGLAAVASADGWHHIAPDGEDVYPDRYAWCGNFQQGRSSVRSDDGTYHHINLDGSAAYRERWRYVGDYRDGVAVVQAVDGYSTHIDFDGRRIHGGWFVDLDVFHKGFARARDEDGWMHVDVRGRPAYRQRFLSVEPFYNGQARVERFDGALIVIDETGVTVADLRPPRRSEFAALSEDMVGFWRTQSIAAAVRLGVVKSLPANEDEIAERCGLTNDGARRLLRALGELGVAVRGVENWSLTPRGEFLLADHPMTLADAALEYAGAFTDMWKRLPEALRRGSDWAAPDVFEDVARDDDRRAGHHRMLKSYARQDYAEVCRALELRGDERIVDAGGGLGVLGQLILEAHPLSQVTVLERPEVVTMGRSSIPGLCWRSGNLFAPWGVDADVVLLSRVLHDWDDDAACQILANARAILPDGGRIYIIEMLLPEGGVSGALCDLHLLMVTGGRERSEEDFARLLSSTGFRLETTRRLASLPSIIVGEAS